jgi:hypothetical protein
MEWVIEVQDVEGFNKLEARGLAALGALVRSLASESACVAAN